MGNLPLPLIMIILRAHFLFGFGTWAFNSGLAGDDTALLTNPSALLDDVEPNESNRNRELTGGTWLAGTPFYHLAVGMANITGIFGEGFWGVLGRLFSGVQNIATFIVRFFTMDYDVLKADGILGVLAWVFIRAPLMAVAVIAIFQTMLSAVSRGVRF